MNRLPCASRSMKRERELPSVSAVSTVDIEDMTRDEPGFVRTEEHDAVGDLLGEAEPTERNLGPQGRLLFRRPSEAAQHAGVLGARPDRHHPHPPPTAFTPHRP